MIAAAILLIVSIGVLPLYTRSISNNLQGQLASDAVNRARSEVERLLQIDFNDPELTVPIGNQELERTEYWVASTHEWKDSAVYSPGDNETSRVITVRQFAKDAFDDEKLEDSEVLPGGTSAVLVHVKEITIRVRVASRTDAPGKAMTLRVFRGT